MQLLKRVGLGLMFWVGGTIGFFIVRIIMGVVHGSATTRPAYAVGIGAMTDGELGETSERKLKLREMSIEAGRVKRDSARNSALGRHLCVSTTALCETMTSPGSPFGLSRSNLYSSSCVRCACKVYFQQVPCFQ